MAKITYTDKENAQITATAANKKISAVDMNDIKTSVNILHDERGWANYTDSLATATQVFTTSPSKISIDASGATTEITYRPLSGTSGPLWDASLDKITPLAVGDAYDARLDITITAKSGNPDVITLVLDIGGGVTISINVFEVSTSIAKTVPFKTSIPLTFFSLSTFVANGGQIFLSTDVGSATVGARGIFIKRDYASL